MTPAARSGGGIGASWTALAALAPLAAPAATAGGGGGGLADAEHEPARPASPPPEAQYGLGPLDIVSQGPMQALRLGLRPRSPATLSEGSWRVELKETLANDLSLTANSQEVDFEMVQSRVSIPYGLSDTVEIELGFQDRSRFGGILDGFILDFHDFFGVEQNGRDLIPEGRNVFRLAADGDDPAADLDVEGSFTRDLLLSLRHRVADGSRLAPAVAYLVNGRVHVGGDDRLGGGEGVDLGLSLLLSKRFGPLNGYVDLGGTWYGQEELAGIDLKTFQAAGLCALEWRVRRDVSLLAQILVSEGAAERRKIFSEPSYEVAAGFKFAPRRNLLIEFGVVEDSIQHNNTSDLAVHLGIELYP